MENTDDPDESALPRASEAHFDFVDEPGYMSPEGSDDPEVDAGPLTLPHERKWNRLRKDYNDLYLDLFKSTFEADDESDTTAGLAATQLGSVLWHPIEKARFFEAVARKGRHDLPAIAGHIGTKSEVEAKDYLNKLQEAEADRQLFEKKVKNVSQIDIRASIEIPRQTEDELEKAADALAAFQEQYDHVSGKRMDGIWLVDYETARALDEKRESLEMARTETADAEITPDPTELEEVTGIFISSNFLILSERFFMNQGSPDAGNWRLLGADEDQRPSITVEALCELRNLVQSITQRLVQSAIFMAKSRIKASGTSFYAPSKVVKPDDVLAAIDVLGMKASSHSFWVYLARRSKFRVLQGSGKKGPNLQGAISYDEVERILSVPTRRRSSSSTSKNRSGSRAPSIISETGNTETASLSDLSDEPADAFQRSRPIDIASDEDNETASISLTDESDFETREDVSSKTPQTARERRDMLEIERDQYLERMDELASYQETAKLEIVLGVHKNKRKVDDQETTELGRRPKVLRKSVEELLGCPATYQAPWEQLDNFEASVAE